MVTTDRYISLDRYAVIRRFTGLGVLIAALCTYFLTMEPTASYWDCPEYIGGCNRYAAGTSARQSGMDARGQVFYKFCS